MPLASTVPPIRSGRPSRIRPVRRSVGVALAAVLAIGLSACAPDPVNDSFLSGDNPGYVAADGAIVEIPVAERGEPVTAFGGVTEDGEDFDSAELAGKVTVVNFWYAGCAPCRVEAPILEEVSQQFGDDGVSFVGVNVRDQAGTAASFEETYGVTYPSILDVESGTAQLAFAGPVPAAAVPTTIVLDQEGRVAARVLGQLTDASILESIIDGILAEQA